MDPVPDSESWLNSEGWLFSRLCVILVHTKPYEIISQCYYPHFTDKETEAGAGGHLAPRSPATQRGQDSSSSFYLQSRVLNQLTSKRRMPVLHFIV